MTIGNVLVLVGATMFMVCVVLELRSVKARVRDLELTPPLNDVVLRHAARLIDVYQRLRDAQAYLDDARRIIGPCFEDVRWGNRFAWGGFA